MSILIFSMFESSHANIKQDTSLRSTLHLLIVEDVMEDVELISITLESAGIKFTYDTAQTALACQQLLQSYRYDAVFVDYHLPSFNGKDVLALVQKSGQEIPLILVTGNLGEEAAVECIKAGMTDYVLKDRLFRLPTVLERSLQEFKLRQQQKAAIVQLQRQAQRETIINRVVQAMRGSLSLDDVMQTTVDQLDETLQISRCLICRLESDDRVTARYASTNAPNRDQILGVKCSLTSYYYQRLCQGEAIAIADWRLLPPHLQTISQQFNLQAVVMVPLLYQESFLGLICLHQCDGQREWNVDEITLVKAIADQCAIAIHQAELYQKAQTELVERQRAEEAVLGIQMQFAAMTANIPGCVYRVAIAPDGTLSLPYISPSVKELTGIDPETAMADPRRLNQIVHPDDRAEFDACLQVAIETLQPYHREYRIILPTGKVRWIQDSARFSKDESGNVIVDGVTLDISDRKTAEEALRDSEQRFRSLIENATDITVILDAQGNYLYLSPSVKRILGYTPESALGRSAFALTHPDDLPLLSQALNRTLQHPGISQPPVEYRIRHRNGSWCVLEAVATNLLHDPSVNGIVINCHDITQRKLVEEQLLHDAFHDALTGLPNRALFLDRLEHALRVAKRRKDYLFAVLFLDLDRFKVVNDSLGHIIGDQLLVAIARRLEKCLRATDTIARLGGDEFVILLEDIDNVSTAASIARRLQQEFHTPLLLDNHEVFITASIGIALNTPNYEHPTQLLRDADTAMYRAKELGRARHEVFNTSMHAHALKLLQLENDLRRAIFGTGANLKPPSNDPPLDRESFIPNSQFLIHYQPIVSLVTGKIVGFESLARWHHPERGFVSPAEFIPVAEETGLIVPIGQWVLRESCRQIRQWQLLFPERPPLTISVNLSVKQFSQPDLIEQIDSILTETNLDGSALKLEITESVLMENAESVTDLLVQLRTRNIHLCIDDFGTGYSSLSYLHRFPTNTLKIDRSFVSRMGVDCEFGKGSIDPTEIVRSIVTLAHNLGMDVVAEGVEDATQQTLLKALKCDYGQGYFFSKPVSSDVATTLIAQEESHYLFCRGCSS